MAEETRTLQATCICNTSAHEIKLRREDFPLQAYMCHCNSCRHMTGSLCLTVAFLPAYYEPDQALLDKLSSFVFSKRITQYFCSVCGCQMLARCLADGDDADSQVTWDVTTGTLEHVDEVLEWQGHEHVQDTLDGGFADMLLEVHGKRLERWPAHFGNRKAVVNTTTKSNTTKELPVYWQSPSRPEAPASSTDKLHAYCKCGGVQFFVARPSARSALAEKRWPALPSSYSIKEADLPDEIESWWLRDHGTKFLAGLCACNSCRLASGLETTFWAFVPTADLSLDENGEIPFTFNFGTSREYTSSRGRHRYFCGTCGATCFYDADDRRFMKDVAVGLLAAPEGARAESWLRWRTHRLVSREDTVPRAEDLSMGIEKGLKAWEEHRKGEDPSGPTRTDGAL